MLTYIIKYMLWNGGQRGWGIYFTETEQFYRSCTYTGYSKICSKWQFRRNLPLPLPAYMIFTWVSFGYSTRYQISRKMLILESATWMHTTDAYGWTMAMLTKGDEENFPKTIKHRDQIAEIVGNVKGGLKYHTINLQLLLFFEEDLSTEKNLWWKTSQSGNEGGECGANFHLWSISLVEWIFADSRSFRHFREIPQCVSRT